MSQRLRNVTTAGTCDARFRPVRNAFVANFAERGEIGAAVCVIAGGRVVADLWGGSADAATGKPWQADTIVNFFSVGKPFAALSALRLVQRGHLDLDAPASRVWPELAAAGKEAVTLRHLLSHRAGLPAIREPLHDTAMLEWRTMTDALARETPWWEPGTAHGYHVNTFGFLVGEMVRRVTRNTIGRVMREEIFGPLDADVHVGLPASEHCRVADFHWPLSASPEAALSPDVSTLSEENRLRWQAYMNPPGLAGFGRVNTTAWRCAEIPSTNGHGSARGVARVYAALANGGTHEGVEVLSGSLLAEATTEHSCGMDRVAKRPSRFGLGFQLTQPERPLGPNPRAFGHFGAGGSLGFCDRDAGVAFAYLMNEMGPRWQNPRNRALLDAVYQSLAA